MLEKGVGRKFWTKDAADSATANLKVVDGLDAYGDRDLVIEAVFEDEAIKKGVFEKLDKVLAPNAVLTSNTSSISISSLASGLSERGARDSWARTSFRPSRACNWSR